MSAQPSLFSAADPLPEGFRYTPDLVSPADEHALVAELQKLPLAEFQFQGFTGKRRVLSFGWRYDFSGKGLLKADDIPSFLLPLRAAAAAFAGMPPESLQHVLLTEYTPGAGIGWHKDKSVFGNVVGVSLLAACRFRFRRKVGPAWERAELTAEPRSAYLLTGPARTQWEHSIPDMEQRRYSITFRNVLEK